MLNDWGLQEILQANDMQTIPLLLFMVYGAIVV